jgi:serine/threonine protein kinase
MLTGQLPFTDEYMPRLQLQILSGRYRPLPTAASPTEPTPTAYGSPMGGVGTLSYRPVSAGNRDGVRLFSEDVRDLVRGMLTVNVQERLNASLVLKHAWFNQ